MTTSRLGTRPRLAALALAATLTVTLAACGGDGGDDVATDTGPTSAPTSEPSSTGPTAPTEEPRPGSLPDYPYQDYAYTLEQRCFCANIDQRYRIAVQDGEVTGVTWATKGEGHEIGDALEVSDYLELTIQDIIDLGNDGKAAKVQVDWPAGQLYPTSVYVDQNKMIADEEVTWMISDVEVA